MNEFLLPQWPQVKAKVESRISSLREQLENPDFDFNRTQVIRGEIRALKRLLGLPEELAEARQSQTVPPGWPGGADA